MKLHEVYETFVKADVLASVPFASGFVLWLPFGARLAEQFEALYREELSLETGYLEFDAPLLIERGRYVASMSESYDYQNMYSVVTGSGCHLVRPDNLLAIADALLREPSPLPIVAQGSLYVSETGRVHPLVKDRHIWRATEVVQWSTSNQVMAQLLEMHLRVFGRLLRRLSIPTLYVESPPLRRHSQRRLLTFTCSSKEEVTLTSTLYHLAPELTRALRLNGKLLDLGFTAKLLAVVAALYSDEKGLVLTSDVAPDKVVVGCRTSEDFRAAGKLAGGLRHMVDRVAVDPAPWHRVLRINRRRGTPIMLLADATNGHRLIRRSDNSSTPLPSNATIAVQGALEDHDAWLRRRGGKILEEAIAQETAVRLAPLGEQIPRWHPLGRVVAVDYLTHREDYASQELHLYALRRRFY